MINSDKIDFKIKRYSLIAWRFEISEKLRNIEQKIISKNANATTFKNANIFLFYHLICSARLYNFFMIIEACELRFTNLHLQSSQKKYFLKIIQRYWFLYDQTIVKIFKVLKLEFRSFKLQKPFYWWKWIKS